MYASRILAATSLVLGSLLAIGPAAHAAGPCSAPTIEGTSDDETLRGTHGPDVIAGAGGDDVLIGLGGDDVLCGGRGQDILRGGPGEDALYGGADAKVAEDTDYFVYYGDTLDGGPDDDTLVPGADRRHDGSVDAVTVAHATDGVTVDLAAGTIASKNDEEPETDTIAGPIATFTGTAYADTIVGSAEPESIYGGVGSDWIDGAGGDDWIDAADHFQEQPDRSSNMLVGGSGDDILNGSAGDDLIRGGPGDDLIQAGKGVDQSYGNKGKDGLSDEIVPAHGQVLSAGKGHDYLADLSFHDDHGRYQRPLAGQIDMAADRLRATYGDNHVSVAFYDFEDVASPAGKLWTIYGTEGDDEISAGFFSDPVRIYARGGDDRVFGSDQDDVINGGHGHDTGTGWGGHDRIRSVERILR